MSLLLGFVNQEWDHLMVEKGTTRSRRGCGNWRMPWCINTWSSA